MGREIKKTIIQACRELVPTSGLYNLTVDEIAARAGISKRTLYRYFRSKEEIIETTILDFINEMAGKIREGFLMEEEPAYILNYFLKNAMVASQTFLTPRVLSDMRTYYPHLWKKLEKYREERIRENIDLLVKKSGQVFPGELNPQIVIAVIIASINAVATPEYIIGNNLTFDETINQLVKVISKILL
ncbi:MAG: TetR/AcrR family transcriptional regulator [Firmicutes bacterium]|nr:TetR/AcrR family transcriptional regulator [Bacillota bacterium]